MTARRLLDLRMADGSRHFADVPARRGLDDLPALRAAIAALPGAVETGCVSDDVTEAWLDFTCGGHAFACNLQFGDWWCFVQDPTAPDVLLATVRDQLHAALADRSVGS